MRYGDATIAKLYLNGELVCSHDSIIKNPDWKQGMPKSEKTYRDNTCHEWTVPLDKYAGQPLLITIASDPKVDGNADEQWISFPVLVKQN